jgi:hypothetical protein
MSAMRLTEALLSIAQPWLCQGMACVAAAAFRDAHHQQVYASECILQIRKASGSETGTLEWVRAIDGPRSRQMHLRSVQLLREPRRGRTLTFAAPPARVPAPNGDGRARPQLRDGDRRPGRRTVTVGPGRGAVTVTAGRGCGTLIVTVGVGFACRRLVAPRTAGTVITTTTASPMAKAIASQAPERSRSRSFLRCLLPGGGECGGITPLMVDLCTGRCRRIERCKPLYAPIAKWRKRRQCNH